MEELIDHWSSCQNSCDGCYQDSQQSVTVCGDDCHHPSDNAVGVPVIDRNVNNIYPPSRDYSAHGGYGLAVSAPGPASQGPASQAPASAQLPTLNYQPTMSFFTTDMAASRGYFDPIRSACHAPSIISSFPPTYMPSYSFPPVTPRSSLPPRPPATPDSPMSSVPLSYATNESPPHIDNDDHTHHDYFRRWLGENEDSSSDTNNRINTPNASGECTLECTPSQENDCDDVVFLYAIKNSEIKHVGQQDKPSTLKWLNPLYLSRSY